MNITPTSLVHDLERAELPRAGTWQIDASHSTVGFWVRHMGVAKVRGVFRSFAGTVEVTEQPDQSSLQVVIDAGSIDTREENRDAHLRLPDFLDVERFPTITFDSSSVSGRGRRWQVGGELTIRGVTRRVVLDTTFEGTQVAGDIERSFFTATTEFDRDDFGLVWNQALETGGVLVGKSVHIELEVQLTMRR